MQTPSFLQPYQLDANAFKLSLLKAEVSYYENTYLPEHELHHGSSQAYRLSKAREALIDARQECAYRSLELTKSEWGNMLRSKAIEAYNEARDWSDNQIIKMRGLRRAIAAIQNLKRIYPELECYSNRFLATSHKIILNQRRA